MKKNGKKVETIKVGVAGLGRSGWDIHCKEMRTMPDKYQIAAVFDPSRERMQEAKNSFACKTYDSFQELIQDPELDLVVVATPNFLHAANTIEALKAGKRVICEKPMATCLKDADAMVAADRKAGGKLTIFQNRRYAADFVTVRKVIDSGVLGRIVQIKISAHGFSRRWDWQTLKKYGGGMMNNTGPHFVDQALALFGAGQPKVACWRDRALALGDADDHFKLVMSGKGHPVVEVELTSCCLYKQDVWLVMGAQGGLTGSSTEIKWKYFNPKNLPERSVDNAPSSPNRGYNSEVIPFNEEEVWKATGKEIPSTKVFYLDLYQNLMNKRPATITAADGRRQIWVFEQCRKLAPI